MQPPAFKCQTVTEYTRSFIRTSHCCISGLYIYIYIFMIGILLTCKTVLYSCLALHSCYYTDTHNKLRIPLFTYVFQELIGCSCRMETYTQECFGT